MEEQQQPRPDSGTLFGLNLDASNSYSLRSAGSWAKVLGVVGILLGIVFILMAVVALSKVGGSSYSSRNEGFDDIFAGNDRSSVGMAATLLIITGVIFVVGAIFSYNFGNRIGSALKANDQNGLERAFAALRNYYALRSIVLIIVLLLFLISFASSI